MDTHFKRMYMFCETPEKRFHNAFILVDTCRTIGLDYDINSLDITDPITIGMVLFCAYLFKKLPMYIPSGTIEFSGSLNQVISKKVSDHCCSFFLLLFEVFF